MALELCQVVRHFGTSGTPQIVQQVGTKPLPGYMASRWYSAALHALRVPPAPWRTWACSRVSPRDSAPRPSTLGRQCSDHTELAAAAGRSGDADPDGVSRSEGDAAGQGNGSDSQGVKRQRTFPEGRACATCGGPLTTTQRTFCGRVCYQAARNGGAGAPGRGEAAQDAPGGRSGGGVVPEDPDATRGISEAGVSPIVNSTHPLLDVLAALPDEVTAVEIGGRWRCSRV